MKRMDRMMAILIALQQRKETASSLAAKLEVSKRTIIRDMQALSEIGVPLCSETGPGGGYWLMEGYQLPPLRFDSEEALVVLFALNAITKFADSPFNQARYTALDKIRSVLPEQLMQQVEPILHHLDMDVPNRRYTVPWLQDLLQHTATSSWVRALYRSEKQERWLQLAPSRVYTAHGFWYCEAYSEQHQEQRTFRVDRIRLLEPLDGPEPVYEREQAQQVRQEAPGIHIMAKLTYRGALLAEQDSHIGHLVRYVDEDKWELDFTCPASEWRWAIKFFYMMGMDAEVIQPLALRQELAQLAKCVANRYVDETEGGSLC